MCFKTTVEMPRPPVGSRPRTGTGVAPRTPARARQMRIYTKILNDVRQRMGTEITSSDILERYMRKYGLTPCEVGTLLDYKDRIELLKGDGNTAIAKYGIYNTMEGPPGQHWYCCYGSYKYDPLGDDTSNTQEQPNNTNDCGQRCIAYLIMCKRNHGPIKGF